MQRIHIKDGRVIDPKNKIDRIGSVYIENGKIVSVIFKPVGYVPDIVIEAQNQIICPGFIDLSTRLREPGQSRKATFASETAAAAKAGVTTMCLQPDTSPVIDTPAIAELVKEMAAKSGYQQILPIGALTQKLGGAELSTMLALKQAGCVAVSNANQPVKNLLVLRRAMEYAASHDLLLICRPNDFWLSSNGCVHEGRLSTRYGLPSVPEAAETIALDQSLELAELTGCRIHFGQISARRSVIKLQQAKKYGLAVSSDVAIHQFHLTEDDITPFDSAYHVQPPFRSQRDREALREGLANGIIDCICSDHQPHDVDAKLGAFPETEPGVSALETLLPLMLKLAEESRMTINQGIASLTEHPARVLGLERGALTPGCPADICIFNPHKEWKVNASGWRSQGINTPFWETVFKGQVTYTVQSGKIIYSQDRAF